MAYLSNYPYIETIFKDVSNRNKLMKINYVPAAIQKAAALKEELYFSVYAYTEDIIQYSKEKQTLAGYTGNVRLANFVIDIDNVGNDLDTLLLVRNEISNLQDLGLEEGDYNVWYSGNGYHIQLRPEYFDFQNPDEVKNTIANLFPNADLSIYARNHIIRAPYSLNRKTMRFKIPLSQEELFTLSVQEIKDLATYNDFRNVHVDFTEEQIQERKEILALYKKVNKAKVSVKKNIIGESDVTAIVTCMQRLYNRGAVVGSRHVEMLRLTSAFRRQGVPKKAIIELLKHWVQNTNFKETEIEKIVDGVFQKGYVYSCNDHIMNEHCDPKCIFYKKKNYAPQISTVENVYKELVDRIVSDKLNYIDLSEFLPIPEEYKIYTGELVVLIADTKLGKSTFLCNVAVHYKNYRWLYVTLENGRLLELQRLLQIAYEVNEKQYIETIKNGINFDLSPINHINLVDDTINTEDLRKAIIQTNSQVVVIDTLDQMDLTGEDITKKTEGAAVVLKNLARELNVIIFAIHHISKSAAFGELNAHSGKGSSSLEQKADKLLGMTGTQNENLRTIKSLLARNAKPFQTTMRFNKENFKFE